MKANQNSKVSIERLKEFERFVIPLLLTQPEKWKTLDVDYHPPRVERLFLEHGNGYRIYLHVIHRTDSECLYHKHKWPAVLKQVYGTYRMGLTYSEKELDSHDAHALPDLACFEIAAGTYYEMTHTDVLHYVKPVSPFSCSIMLTNDLYPEHVFRKEALNKKLKELSQIRKLEILELFKNNMTQK